MSEIEQIVIIGAGGFIGRSLCHYFYLQDTPLKILGFSKTYQWNYSEISQKNCSFFVSDASSLSEYSSLLDKPSLIIYMAGSTDLSASESNPIEDYRYHINSLLAFLSLLNGKHKLIFLSSGGAVYGEPMNEVSHENDQLSPKSIYGNRNKILEDLLYSICTKKQIDHIVLRLANPYGLSQLFVNRKGLIFSLMQSAIDRTMIKIRGDGNHRRDYFAINDFCELIADLALSKQEFPCSVMNVGSGVSYSARAVVALVSDLMGAVPNIVYQQQYSNSDVVDSSLDVTYLQSYCSSLPNAKKLFLPLEQSILSFDLNTFLKFRSVV